MKTIIAIIGGGPGGLTLARLLQQQGAQVTVYERDRSREVRVQGATLDLHHDSGLLALEVAGLTEAFLREYRPGADYTRVLDNQANIIWEDGDHGKEKEAYRPEIDRGPLRDLLLDSLTPGTVVWDSHLQSLEEMNGGWQLTFANGSVAYADLVVGADGANSKVRALVTDIRPFYAGITIVEGAVTDSRHTIPQIHEWLHGGKLFVLGDEKSLIVSSKGDGSLVFYTGCKTGEAPAGPWNDRDAALAWFESTFQGWNPAWADLFKNASLPLTIRPQYCMPPDQDWTSRHNITLLGDAAHLMPPYAGEGVNMAMLDALELSQALAAESDPAVAITRYETGMRKRAGEIARMTLEQTEALHSPNGLQHLVSLWKD